jgi:hypothetical protein
MADNNLDFQKRKSDTIIELMQKDVLEIKTCLLGTFDKQGYIAKTSERITKLEDKQNMQWWLIAMITMIVIAGSMKVFFA